MNAAAPVNSPPRPAPTLYVIVGIKLLKGVVTLLLAFGVYSLTDNNLPADFQKLLLFLHLDPEKKFFVDLAKRVGDITPAGLAWVAIGSGFYSGFMMLQSIGLFFRLNWVVWLVIGESCFFVPIEIFEIVNHPTWLISFVLALNIFIIWYLVANRTRLIKRYH